MKQSVKTLITGGSDRKNVQLASLFLLFTFLCRLSVSLSPAALTHDNLILGFWRELKKKEEEVADDDDDLDLLRERGVGRAPNGQGVHF